MRILKNLRRSLLLALFTGLMLGLGACGGGSNNGTGEVLDPVGNFFVEKFIFTSSTDVTHVESGTSIGLSFYFTLNGDGTLNGTVQISSSPPTSTPFTGTWTNLGNNNIDIKLNVAGESLTVSGALFLDSSGNVLFEGAQTGGTGVRFAGSQELFEISDMSAHQYGKPLTNADLVGTWVLSQGLVISNADNSQKMTLPQPGTGTTVTFNSDGTFSDVNTSPNNPPVNQSGTYKIVDDFHIQLTMDQQPAVSQVFGVRDNTLTVYIYDQSQVIPPSSTPVSSTEVSEFTRQ